MNREGPGMSPIGSHADHSLENPSFLALTGMSRAADGPRAARDAAAGPDFAVSPLFPPAFRVRHLQTE